MSTKKIADVSTAMGPKRRGDVSSRSVPTLTILAHPIAARSGERLVLHALASGKEVAISRNEPDFAHLGSALGAPLGDPFVSRRPLRLMAGTDGRIRLCVDEGGTKVVVLGRVVTGAVEIDAEELERGVPIELADRVALLLHEAPQDAATTSESLGMLGQSAGVRRVRTYIERIVDLGVPVLIRGETGTGKELVARAIHERSPRRQGPFVSVNLGAIPKELAAAELFGAHKGAYTGATRDREGFFRAAHGGTLFLDEVGEAPPEVQVMLLRVLETGEIYPIGGQTPVAANVRLLAATDADLETHIREGRFRAPLLHRLAGYEIRMPPLRERREDIGALFYHFAREELAAIGEAARLAPADPYAEPWLPASIAARLALYPWPGNVRQLRNVTRQLVIGSRGQEQLQIDPRLAEELASASAPPRTPAPSAPSIHVVKDDAPPRRKPSDVAEEELVAALRESAWDLKGAADRLGIPRSSIYDLIERSPNIRTAGDLSAEEIERCFHECRGDLDAMVKRLSVSSRALNRRLKELGLTRGSSG